MCNFGLQACRPNWVAWQLSRRVKSLRAMSVLGCHKVVVALEDLSFLERTLSCETLRLPLGMDGGMSLVCTEYASTKYILVDEMDSLERSGYESELRRNSPDRVFWGRFTR